MERSHEVTTVQKLLKEDGSLREPGWSKKINQIYDRADIKAPKSRIKEWDYYLVLKEDFAFAFIVSDDGYIGLQTVTLIDFKKLFENTKTIVSLFPMGKLKMPPDSSSGRSLFKNKQFYLDINVEKDFRRIVCTHENFYKGNRLEADIILETPEMDTMVIATPWNENKKAFYYNQKINCMRASGKVTIGNKEYIFDREQDFGTLDWGRGVWTYDNEWYWGSGNGIIDGKVFGFNIGYGFGNTAAATENVIFYEGKAHKFDDIVFNIPNSKSRKEYMRNWTFNSSDGRFEADFIPVFDKHTKVDAKVLKTDGHQVFGRMTGKAILDDGRVIDFKNLFCFAEDVHMRY